MENGAHVVQTGLKDVDAVNVLRIGGVDHLQDGLGAVGRQGG